MSDFRDLIERAERLKNQLRHSRDDLNTEVARLREQLKVVRENIDDNRRLIDQRDRETRQLKKENEWLGAALKDLTEWIEEEGQVPAELTELADLVGELHEAVNTSEALKAAPSEEPTADCTLQSNAAADNGDERLSEAVEDPTIPRFLRKGPDWFQRA